MAIQIGFQEIFDKETLKTNCIIIYFDFRKDWKNYFFILFQLLTKKGEAIKINNPEMVEQVVNWFKQTKIRK